MKMVIRPFGAGDERICESILRALPEWFGIESSLVQYVKDTMRYPTWLAETEEGSGPVEWGEQGGRGGRPSGFVTGHRHFPPSAEIHVIGIHPAFHRRGIGRRLVTFVEDMLRKDGCKFLQVKTLDESRPCDAYAKTRLFYQAMGFVPLEMFPTLWPGNPALMLIKSL
jgi:ribosomal protein S18 acetylase RimI-like enzyme